MKNSFGYATLTFLYTNTYIGVIVSSAGDRCCTELSAYRIDSLFPLFVLFSHLGSRVGKEVKLSKGRGSIDEPGHGDCQHSDGDILAPLIAQYFIRQCGYFSTDITCIIQGPLSLYALEPGILYCKGDGVAFQ